MSWSLPSSKVLPRFPELDGLRGVAVLLVFCHHVTLFGSVGPWNALQYQLSRICGPGHAGVDVFFVLSGFLITSMLLPERERASYYRDFYWKRVLRVLPLYALVLVLLLAFVPHSARYVLLAFFFLANFASVVHLSLITPFWSLAVEEQFYLVWPMIVRGRSNRQVARFAGGLAVACLMLRFVFAVLQHHNYYLTFLHCDGLALGALLACRFSQSREEGRSFATESPKLWAVLGLGLVTAVGAQWIPDGRQLTPYFANLELTGITLTCFGVIGLCIAHTNSRRLAFLRVPSLRFLGLISYAFYVIHLFVIQAYDRFSPTSIAGNNVAYAIRLAVVFAISIGLSLLSRYAIELPALSLRRRVLSHPQIRAERHLPPQEANAEVQVATHMAY